MFTLDELCRNEIDYRNFLEYNYPNVPKNPFSSEMKHPWAHSVSMRARYNKNVSALTAIQYYINAGDTCVYRIVDDFITMGFASQNRQDSYNRKLGVRIALLRMLEYPVNLSKSAFINAYYELSQKLDAGSGFCFHAPLMNKAVLSEFFTFEKANAYAIATVCAYVIEQGSDDGFDSRGNWRAYYHNSEDLIRQKYCKMKDFLWEENMETLDNITM